MRQSYKNKKNFPKVANHKKAVKPYAVLLVFIWLHATQDQRYCLPDVYSLKRFYIKLWADFLVWGFKGQCHKFFLAIKQLLPVLWEVPQWFWVLKFFLWIYSNLKSIPPSSLHHRMDQNEKIFQNRNPVLVVINKIHLRFCFVRRIVALELRQTFIGLAIKPTLRSYNSAV